jgi:hypothetical protein
MIFLSIGEIVFYTGALLVASAFITWYIAQKYNGGEWPREGNEKKLAIIACLCVVVSIADVWVASYRGEILLRPLMEQFTEKMTGKPNLAYHQEFRHVAGAYENLYAGRIDTLLKERDRLIGKTSLFGYNCWFGDNESVTFKGVYFHIWLQPLVWIVWSICLLLYLAVQEPLSNEELVTED